MTSAMLSGEGGGKFRAVISNTADPSTAWPILDMIFLSIIGPTDAGSMGRALACQARCSDNCSVALGTLNLFALSHRNTW